MYTINGKKRDKTVLSVECTVVSCLKINARGGSFGFLFFSSLPSLF